MGWGVGVWGYKLGPEHQVGARNSGFRDQDVGCGFHIKTLMIFLNQGTLPHMTIIISNFKINV